MIRKFVANKLEKATNFLLPIFFTRSFFQSSLLNYLMLKHHQKAPRLFLDPFECIGASVVVSASYYEQSTLAAVRQYLKNLPPSPLVYVDVGANLGNHLVALGDLYEYGIGFEPIPFNYHLCLANLAYNQLDHKVLLHQLALGRKEGQIELQLPMENKYLSKGQRNNGMFTSGSSEIKSDYTNSGKTYQVKVEPGAKFLQTLITPARRFLVKVDCEGAEPSILLGMKPALVGNPRCEFIFLIEILNAAAFRQIISIFEDINDELGNQGQFYQLLTLDPSGRFVHANSPESITLPQSALMIHLHAQRS